MDKNYRLETADDVLHSTKITTDNHMTLDEIYQVIADIGNSIYNLRKYNKITFEHYDQLKKQHLEFERVVRFTIFDTITLNRYMPGKLSE